MKYIKCLRIKHYIKNFLIFLPLFFSGNLFSIDLLKVVILGFFAFSLLSSIIYIINDIKDVEFDKNNNYKKNRPIARGEVSIVSACVLVLTLIAVVIIINLFVIKNLFSFAILFLYLFLNILYSIFGYKNIPIVDLVILTFGFVLRVIYGSVLTNITISNWLYLTIFSFSFFFSLCKRRNEFRIYNDKSTRKVLKYYNYNFLDKNTYMFLTMGNIFYSLWALNTEHKYFVWTVPIVSILSLRYSYTVEGDSSGDPIEVIFKDKILCLLMVAFVIITFVLMYII